ncbi:hypothetical protein [Mycoplasmopsis cynos]|uniref:hypothetical protein n=1 Tax=Mycoplasmopsis cynos TaxID=171284 RepID=UPI0024C91B31|nr:hypothetical protein [Mycoplasmopsis cynos]WAM05029.1 hypothetical protein ONA01_02540 [Mycoplasmopsis cynos]
MNIFQIMEFRLIRGKDNSIFVIMPVWAQNLYNSIIGGIITSSSKSGRRVNTTYSNSNTVDYIETIRYALSWRPLAIVVFVLSIRQRLIWFFKKSKWYYNCGIWTQNSRS